MPVVQADAAGDDAVEHVVFDVRRQPLAVQPVPKVVSRRVGMGVRLPKQGYVIVGLLLGREGIIQQRRQQQPLGAQFTNDGGLDDHVGSNPRRRRWRRPTARGGPERGQRRVKWSRSLTPPRPRTKVRLRPRSDSLDKAL